MIRRVLVFIVLIGFALGQAEILWQTTHGTPGRGEVRISRNKIQVKVHPGYLDVEEDVEIQTLGQAPAGGDANSLEIFGDFRLPEGSAVVGMLLWNGNTILKARLKDRAIARQQYEDVVDRDEIPPPRPRDPALIEAMGNDSYRFSVYPVRSGFSRRLRLRYHVPSAVHPEGLGMRFFPVFAMAHGRDGDAVIEAAFSRLEGQAEYALAGGNGVKKPLSLPSTYLFSTAQPFLVLHNPPPQGLAIRTHFEQGGFKGYYAALLARLPPAVLELLGEPASASGISVAAQVGHGEKNLNVELRPPCAQVGQSGCGGLVFHGKAGTPWLPEVTWIVSREGKEVLRHRQTLLDAGNPGDSALAILWAADGRAYAEAGEDQLGTRYGFVDPSASLLALEEDVLAEEEQVRYRNAGVPRLTDKEIFRADPATGFVTNEPLPPTITDPNQASVALADAFAGPEALKAALTGGGRTLRLSLPEELRALPWLVLTLHDMDGKVIWSWTVSDPRSEELNFDVPALQRGIYVLRIEARGLALRRTLSLSH